MLNYLFVISIITVLSATIYAAVQQNCRTAADDPQVQIVRDINYHLHHGKAAQSFLRDTVNIAENLAPFVAFYNAAGKPLYSSGHLHNEMPIIPKGVFDFAKEHGERRVTWQPEPGVRMAMVIETSNVAPVAFIASGRSLMEVEAREYDLRTTIFFAWIICVGLVLLHAAISFYLGTKSKSTV